MTTEAYPGVIVSGNRFNDIGPYAKRTLESDKKTWGSIFPWEFPQNGTREQEETFLRLFFTDAEIHMQGGAAGEGSGFRFLKQVWYCIALCNIEQRVPYVEEWFWKQPDSVNFLNDPSMRISFVAPTAKPSTFFESNERQQYGEKFLKMVVDRIQLTAKTYYEQQHFSSELNVLEISQRINQSINKSLGAQSATPVEQAASARAPSVKPKRHISQQDHAFQQPVLPPTREAIHPKVHRERTGNNGETQIRPAKRGGYHGNKRGSQHHGRSYNSFDDGFSHQYPSQTYGAPPGPTYGQKRGLSGGHTNFMPSIPQGQPLLEAREPMKQQPHPQPVHNMSSMQQYSLPHGGPYMQGQQPIYYSTNVFADHGQIPFPDAESGGNMDFAVQDGSYNGHYEGRRNSVSGRGRGYNSVRGRGVRSSRGRNSFGTSDQVPRVIKGDGFNHRGGGEYKGRRYSGMPDGSRSGHEYHQANAMKENMAPGRAFPGSEYHPSYNDEVRSLLVDKHCPTSTTNDWEHDDQGPRQASHTFMRHPLRKQPIITEVETCGQNWISPECTTVTKLVAFSVPGDLNDVTLLHTLRQFGEVASVKRFHATNADNRTKSPTGLVFLNFDRPQTARLFFENKPRTWLDGMPLKIEVAKEYWDPNHWSNLDRFGSKPFYAWKSEVRKDTPFIEKVSVPVVVNRTNQATLNTGHVYTPRVFSKGGYGPQEVPSEDTTPTPSGSNTPKKKNKFKNKNKKAKEFNDGLRKLSLIANADQRVQTDQVNDDAGLPAKAVVNEITPQANSCLPQPDCEVDADKKAGASSCEAASSAAKRNKTISSDTLPRAQKDQLPSTAQMESPSEAAAATFPSPADHMSSSAEAPRDHSHDHESSNRSFRASPKETKEAEASTVDSPIQDLSSDTTQTREQVPARSSGLDQGNPDDNFHTASGSSGSVAHVGKEKQSESTPSPPTADTLKSSGPDTTSATTETTSEASQTEVTGLEGTNKDSERPRSNCASILNTSTTANTTADTHTSPECTKKTVSPIATKPKVTITTYDSALESTVPQSEKRSASGSTIAPLTPAFVTAPNTPAVDQGTSIAEAMGGAIKAEVEPEAPQIKKVDKAKGPAQTESLSLFGRKKEKKPKPLKKATIKGKPNPDNNSTGVTSGESSRRTSDFHGTGPAATQAGKATDDGKMSNADGSAIDDAPKSLKTPKSSKKGSELCSKAHCGEESSISTGVEESPSKRKGNKFGSMISNLFGGGGGGSGGGAHLQAPALDATALNESSSTSLLTDSKARDLLRKSEIKQSDHTVGGVASGLESNEAAALDKQDVTAAELVIMDSPTANNGNSILTGRNDAWVDDGVGLGISDVHTEHQTDNGVKAKKKRKKQPKKKKKQSGAGTDSAAGNEGPSELSTPVSEPKPGMYRFGGSEPVPTSPTDDVSLASSTTQAGDTPTSESLSPFAAVAARKMMMANSGAGNLLQPKTPAWLKKRGPIHRTSEPNADEVEDDEMEEADDDEEMGRIITLDAQELEATDDEQSDRNTSESDPNASKRLYIYVGPGRIADAADELRLEQSDEEQQRRALEEVKRMVADGDFVNGEFDDYESSSVCSQLTDPASSSAESTS